MAVKAAERYANFSDNTMQDRLAAHAACLAREQRKSKGSKTPDEGKQLMEEKYKLEPSGRCEGWDKYYFFSVPGFKVAARDPPAGEAGKGGKTLPIPDPPLKLPCANLGRQRPAAHGPQTFCNEAFSKEMIQQQRSRIEKKGGGGSRSAYQECFSQMPRAATATLGLPQYEGQKFASTASNSISPGMLNRSASDTMLQSGPPALAHSMGTQERQRMGPHWPPKTEQRPDSLSTRKALFPGGHRTIVDLYSQDRPAARGVGYAVFVG